jgi:exonuclease SbcC
MENFRNHRKTEITLDRINFFVGHNNAGKTSILAAIDWGLTGRCMWTDRAGRGAAELVRQGEKRVTVVLEVEGLGAVVRSLPPHSLQVGRASGVNEGQAAIHNFLGVDEDRLRVAINATAFLSMSPAEQRAFLFSAYGLTWTADQVVEELARWLSKKGHKEEDARRLAEKAKDYYPAGITGGPEIFEAMEKRAKEERKELKKDRQRAEAALADIQNSLTAAHAFSEELAKAREKKAALLARRDELLQACGAGREARARRQVLAERIAQAENRLAETRAKAQALATEVAALGGPESDQDRHWQELEQKLQEQLEAANGAAAAVRSRMETIDRAGRALAGKERRCPLAPDVLQCGLTEEQLQAVLKVLRQEYKALARELDKHQAVARETAEKLADIRQKLTECQDRAKRALALEAGLKAQRQMITRLEEDLAGWKDELAGLREPDQTLLEELDLVEAMLREEEDILAREKELEALAGRIAALERDMETLAREVADIEVLVKALGPDGLRKDLLAGILEGFVGRANDRLGRLTGGAYQIDLAPDMTILCRADGGPLLPLKLLSKSEQLRVGIAVSEALSAAAGLRFLAIDEADMLDQENRDLLAGMLLDTAEDFDQVLVFTTVGDVRPENPGIPGVKMFWVEEGTVREL